MLLRKFLRTIQKFHLVNKGDKILIGVSGGPDSVALLYLLNHLRKDLNLELYIAHLDHGLRVDSRKDRDFVQDLGRKLKIKVISARCNIKKSRRGSLEESARLARLGFFFKTARAIKVKKIALGHNLDDQAETVLMRILRGAGLYGLGAILPRRRFGSIEVIRPLLEIKRRQIESFLKRKKITPRLDYSNQQSIYFRNKIRHNLLPLLEKEYSRGIKRLLCNIAESSALDYEYLRGQALRFVEKTGKSINLKIFLKLHPAIQRLVIRLQISKLKGNMRRIGFRHIREIEDLILSRPVNSIVDLPGNISVVKRRNSLLFRR